eukprot:gene3129-1432_t
MKEDSEYEDDGTVSNEIIKCVSENCQNATTGEKENKSYSMLLWSGTKKRTPLVNFSVASLLVGAPFKEYEVIKQYHMTFKFVRTESRIVRKILAAHGYKEAHPHSNNFNLLWSGGHFRPYTIRGLREFQKANHFPRSFELTRKDKLYRNVQRMQQCKGTRHFDFIPTFFVLPSERSEFHSAFLKDKGPWIVKPVASSRGRGIFLIKDANMVPYDEQVLVCRYIESPLLVDGFKFDCRIYVGVTSFDPLTVYMYKEGLARFSTVKYEKNFNNIRNLWMHLTNYSIQKNNENYIRCDDPDVDNYGSKWSFSGLLRHLKSKGIDTKALMSRIEDVIVKTLLSAEFSVGTACRMFIPHKNCCFELYGFDILIDEDLKPWLLEVNLSPSLACESPLDLKIKANLLTDLFNLTGFIAKDPVTVKPDRRKNSLSARSLPQRYRSFSSSSTDIKPTTSSGDLRKTSIEGLSNEELRMIREAKEEYKRRGKFVRIYPTPESWEMYNESPLDLKIKANLLTDLFNLTGFIAKDPVTVKPDRRKNSLSARSLPQRYRSFSSSSTDIKPATSSGDLRKTSIEGLSNEELRMIREAKEEYKRRGKFVRIYPTPESWEMYNSLQEHSSGKNKALHAGLFPELWSSNQRPSSARYVARSRPLIGSASRSHNEVIVKETAHGMGFQRRYLCYEKKLDSWDQCLSDNPNNDEKPNGDVPEFASYEQVLLGKKSGKNADFDLGKIIENGNALSASAQRQILVSAAEEAKQEEQMSLMLRFLKRAAVNFRCPMAIISPSKSLPMQEKQRMLVRQLKDFISIYRQETKRLSGNTSASKTKDTEDISEKSSVSSEAFHMFLTVASENELEELLSIFTRSNKAASIFLGEPEENLRQRAEQVNLGPKLPSSNAAKDNDSSHSTWKDLLLKRDSQTQPPLIKYNNQAPKVRVFGDRLAADIKQRPASANPPESMAKSLAKGRPASAMAASGKNAEKEGRHTDIKKSQNLLGVTKHGNGLSNHLPSKKRMNHLRHSSAPSQRTFERKSRDADENNNFLLQEKSYLKESAERTFEHFIRAGAPSAPKVVSDDFGTVNDISKSKGTQTFEGPFESHDEYFKSRESKRINANAKRAQKVYYETYLKELKNEESKDMVPHPPAIRPSIKKPVNTSRINR